MASIVQRGRRGTWWIKYRVGNRQIFHSLHTSNERVALTAKRRVEAEATTGQLLAPSRIPLPAFLEEFCRYLSTRRTRKSFSADCSALRIFFGPICQALQLGTHTNQRFVTEKTPRIEDRMREFHVDAKYLEEVTPALIEGFITRRILESGISPKTGNRYREILHVMFNYAIRTRNFVSPDRRHPNPAAAVQRRAEPPRTIRFLSAEEIVHQLLILEGNPTIRAMVATYIYAGVRREEALWLTHEDVDLERRLIRVVAKRVKNEFWQPKTKRNRVVPLPP